MYGHGQDPTSRPGPEILTGPGPGNRPDKRTRTLILAAAALVTLLVAGGVGFALLGGSGDPGKGTPVSEPAGRTGETNLPETPAGGEEAAGEPEEAPSDGIPADGEPAEDGTGGTASTDTGSTGTGSTDTGAAGSGSGDAKTPAKKPTPAPSTAAPEVDNPADGPGGMVGGQCAKSGC